MTRPAFLIAFFLMIVRYYDYALFGLSAEILSSNFLPIDEKEKQLLLFFAIFSATVIAKPFGSIIFGFISDKYGRIVSVKISIFLATISTALIGLTPEFNKIGIFATIILIFCRMVFLMSLAGESDTIKIYVAEKVGSNYKNYANGIVSFCSQVGVLLAATTYHFSTELVNIPSLWRVNFLIGGMFGLFIIFMRHFFQESEVFIKDKKERGAREIKLFDLANIIRNHLRKFITALLISGCTGGIYHFLIIFWIIFITKIALIMSSHDAKLMNMGLIAIYASTSILSGFLADKYHPKKQIIISLSLSILAIIVSWFFLDQVFFPIYFAMVGVALAPFYTIPLQIIIQSIFRVEVRTRMCSLSHSIGGMIFSSTTPFFCMLLWQYFHSLYLVLGFFLLLLLILSSSVIYLYNKYEILSMSFPRVYCHSRGGGNPD